MVFLRYVARDEHTPGPWWAWFNFGDRMKMDVVKRSLDVPMVDAMSVDGVYQATYLGNFRLSRAQSLALKRVVEALKQGNCEASKPGGRLKRVEDGSDAIRWFLDRLGDGEE